MCRVFFVTLWQALRYPYFQVSPKVSIQQMNGLVHLDTTSRLTSSKPDTKPTTVVPLSKPSTRSSIRTSAKVENNLKPLHVIIIRLQFLVWYQCL